MTNAAIEEPLNDGMAPEQEALAAYVEEDDAATQLVELPHSEPRWLVQLSPFDRRAMGTAELVTEVLSERLPPSTRVWRDGMRDWTPIEQLLDLPAAPAWSTPPSSLAPSSMRPSGLPPDSVPPASLPPSSMRPSGVRLAELAPAQLQRASIPPTSERAPAYLPLSAPPRPPLLAPHLAGPVLSLAAFGIACAVVATTLAVLSAGGVFEPRVGAIHSATDSKRHGQGSRAAHGWLATQADGDSAD